MVKPGTSNFFVPIEELFDKIHEAHIEKGHPGRDIMQKYLATKYANVTTEHINIYCSFCEKCGLKKSKARSGVIYYLTDPAEQTCVVPARLALILMGGQGS